VGPPRPYCGLRGYEDTALCHRRVQHAEPAEAHRTHRAAVYWAFASSAAHRLRSQLGESRSSRHRSSPSSSEAAFRPSRRNDLRGRVGGHRGRLASGNGALGMRPWRSSKQFSCCSVSPRRRKPLATRRAGPATSARIYVYVQAETPARSWFPILCDGTMVAKLKRGRFFAINVAPGRHLLGAKESLPVFVTAESGEDSFVRVEWAQW
jgi:hypothetical protein